MDGGSSPKMRRIDIDLADLFGVWIVLSIGKVAADVFTRSASSNASTPALLPSEGPWPVTDLTSHRVAKVAEGPEEGCSQAASPAPSVC